MTGGGSADSVTGTLAFRSQALRCAVTKLEPSLAPSSTAEPDLGNVEGLVQNITARRPGRSRSHCQLRQALAWNWKLARAWTQLAALADRYRLCQPTTIRMTGCARHLTPLPDLTAAPLAGYHSMAFWHGMRLGSVALHRRMDPYPYERSDGGRAGHHPRHSFAAKVLPVAAGVARVRRHHGGVLAGAVSSPRPEALRPFIATCTAIPDRQSMSKPGRIVAVGDRPV